MGDLLRDMMNERADTHATPELDLDAIIRAGDRRVWRRRAIMGVGAAAAVVTLAITAPAVLDSVREDAAKLKGRLGSLDRQRLDAHLDGVRQLEEKIMALPPACSIPEKPTEANEDIAGVEPIVAASPMPLAPSGLRGVGVSVECTSKFGRSAAEGTR